MAELTFFSRTLAAFGIGGLGNLDVGVQSPGPVSNFNESGVTISDERALGVSAVWSCVRLITETIGTMPLLFYRQDRDGQRDLMTRDHWIVQRMRKKPNPAMDALNFREALTMQLCLWGNAYALIQRVGPRVVNLWPMKPSAMEVLRRDNGTVFYRYQTGSGIVEYEASEIFHIKGFGPDGIIGLSPLGYARQAMGVTVSADMYAAKSFAGGGLPKGTLEFEDFLNKTQREAAREMYTAITAGAENSGVPWVLEGGTKYNPLSIPPDDMQMLQSRTYQLGEIARIFRVPSHLINDSQKSTAWGSGIEQLTIGWLIYGLSPYLRRWERAIVDQLLVGTEQDTIIPEHNVEGLLRADSASRAAFYSTMVQNGLFTRNEVRRKENLRPIDGGDELTAQVNLTPVDQLRSIADAAQQPDPAE